ncbi:MAG: 2Fe-2S iron-sulfur cluster binding domain-containing protein [Planctomycetes bacterium]|nr:2Fe-2S iron-sulfur cluster binding domain-containing protein [Planctomycetota bacterium]
MPKIVIDSREIDAEPGENIVDAAARAGIEIPTLCYLKGYDPSTSCQVCLVKDARNGRLVPACGTRVVEGMRFESETPDVHDARRVALELLLSEHVGDCRAPCDFACPCHMDIPLMLEQIHGQHLRDAIVTVKRDIALPAALGRVCPKPCEKGCRRNDADGPVAVCDLKRYVADADLASGDPYAAPCLPDSGKRIAVVGGGPSGLSAVYYLRRAGHACALFEQRPELGGRLRTEERAEDLPRDLLDAEIAQITRLGVDLHLNTAITDQPQLDSLASEFDAVVLACGVLASHGVERFGLKASRKGIDVDRETYATNRPGVFAIGNALRGKGLVVRSCADGKEVAHIVGRFAAGRKLEPASDFSSRMGKLLPGELPSLMERASPSERRVPSHGTDYDHESAIAQSIRCMECACPSHGKCKLERYSAIYGADPNRFTKERPPYELIGRNSSVVFEPGKCIKCELCIQIARRGGEPIGLSFVGRGFDVVVSVPFGRGLDEALTNVAAECVEACPTAALRFANTLRGAPDLVTLEVPGAACGANGSVPPACAVTPAGRST